MRKLIGLAAVVCSSAIANAQYTNSVDGVLESAGTTFNGVAAIVVAMLAFFIGARIVKRVNRG